MTKGIEALEIRSERVVRTRPSKDQTDQTDQTVTERPSR